MTRARRPALGGGWTLWPHLLVRGAGFPFAALDEAFRAPDVSAALRRVAGEPTFREAVLWQNRAAVVDGLDSLVRRPAGATDSKTRKKELLVARYLQRYCAKNDTIGFFGPVGWATAGDAPHSVPAERLLAGRATFFEPWAVLALAQAEAQDPEARLAFPVSLPGDLRLEGSLVTSPTSSYRFTREEVRVLAAARGQPARVLVARLAGKGRGHAERARAVQALLARLAGDGVLRWEARVALSLQPAKWRSSGLDALEAARARVAAAAGDHRALEPALAELDATFEAQAKVASKRHQGRTYGGRGLVFEDCRRELTLSLGPRPIERVAPALRVVLKVARWYTFSIAVRVARALEAVHQKLGGGRVPLHVFWHASSPAFEREVPPSVAAVAKQLRTRWNRLWAGAEPRDGGVWLDPAAAERFVDRHFAAPCPGWPGARHHAPDLMWGAPSAEALLAGEGQPVLAELHPGVTPFTTLSVLSLCPVREALEALWAQDFPDPLVSPIPSEDFARSSQDARLARRHLHLDVGGPYASERPAKDVARAADFDVVARRGRLIAVHRERGLTLDLLAVFERRIKLRAAVGFSLSDGEAIGPRRFLGPLLVQRAHLRVETATLPFLEADSRQADFQAWARGTGLPERVFVRAPQEVKPVYIDFASPLSVEMLVRLARQSPWLSFSEMVPDPSGLWLRDAQGAAFVSELRFIAVDPQPWDGPTVWAAAA